MATKPKYYFATLPCKPYIRKYVRSFYGEPVPANNKSTLGNFVNACLSKERYTEHYFSESFIHKNLTDKLVFQISAFAFINIGFNFPTGKIVELNQFLENRFEEHLFMHCNTHYVPGKNERRKLIEAFAESYGIELDDDLAGKFKADISLDALVKTEYRMRKEIERKRSAVAS